MHFKHPEFLYALFLLVIPVIIHLFQLRRFKKEAFTKFIENYKYANDRTLLMKMEHAIDMVNFEEPFVQSIEALLELHFNKNQVQIIHWWLYEKWNTGDETVLQLNNTETGEELPSDTPEELWDLIQSLK